MCHDQTLDPKPVSNGYVLLHHYFILIVYLLILFARTCVRLSHLLQQAKEDRMLNSKPLCCDLTGASSTSLLLISLSACSGNTTWDWTKRRIEHKQSDWFVCKWLRGNACRGVWNANSLDYSMQKQCSHETAFGLWICNIIIFYILMEFPPVPPVRVFVTLF